MKYLVNVGGRQVEVVITGDGVTVDGRAVDAVLERVEGTPEVRLHLDGRLERLAVDTRTDEGWRLVDRGAVRDIEAVDERTHHIRSLTAAAGGASRGGVLKAPMPGLVVRVQVAVGDTVEAGQGLVVLEAMKMENELKAPAAGTVTAISAIPGQAVEKGAILLQIGD
ncbi:MAG TPA: biotin/lipoyl-containing protein [Gemmatimonadales bacterium]|nr:biotin/lipoyl-containing protein [Gemmatimonadales bacterium]